MIFSWQQLADTSEYLGYTKVLIIHREDHISIRLKGYLQTIGNEAKPFMGDMQFIGKMLK